MSRVVQLPWEISVHSQQRTEAFSQVAGKELKLNENHQVNHLEMESHVTEFQRKA